MLLSHPVLNAPAVQVDTLSQLIYEGFLLAIPFERNDVACSAGRHLVSRLGFSVGDRYLVLFDQTYGSLRLTGRLLDEEILRAALGAASAIAQELEDVGSYLTDHPMVIFAFLFGSHSKGRARHGSDVDVAVHLDTAYGDADLTTIWDKLEDITHKDVDLVVLNHAPPGVAWAAMKGKLLVEKKPRLRLELMLEVSREAEDSREFQLDF